MRGPLLLAVAMTAIATPALAEDFCTEFRQVAAQGVRGFRDLRGVKDEDTDSWTALLRLPGASHCSVSEDGMYSKFSCGWSYEAGQADQAIAAARTLADGVRNCLGPKVVYGYADREQPPQYDSRNNWTELWSDNIVDVQARETIKVRATRYEKGVRRTQREWQSVAMVIQYRRSR